MNEIEMYIIPQTVKLRKFDVDTENLKQLLRTAKKANVGLSNKQIAEELDVPMTKVEHWFRTDKCFAIPDEDIWFELKDLLQITTDEFDAPITEFVYQQGSYDMANRVYGVNGIAPTITTSGNINIIY